MIMAFLNSLSKMDFNVKLQIFGYLKETHGKFKELMFNIKFVFMATPENSTIKMESKKSFGKMEKV